MSKQAILITGGAGFVGSNLAILLKSKYPGYSIICMDSLKRRGSELNLTRLKEREIEFVHGDIRQKSDFDQIQKQVTCVIDAAAEPSVLAGTNGDTDYLIQTNFNGTIHSLDFALKHKAGFVLLSTSRVYPIKYLEKVNVIEERTRFEIAPSQTLTGVTESGISESFPLTSSRSLYGSTKLASELMVEEYHEMFGLNTVINRCGIVSGAYQMGKIDQGVVVLWMAKHFWKGELSYIGYGGTGKQVRDILHVNDLFALIDLQVHQPEKFNGKTYNIGGSRKISASLFELTELCKEITGNNIAISAIPETRKADIKLYLSDCYKIKNHVQWEPQIRVKDILHDIFVWIKNNEKQLKPILS